ncbi:MAG: hypothetical protein NTY01_24490 [Verrucomicrobia bacterium]|nr:hypothetical protein [Verrucomicrobiota bacterium]
MNFPTKWIGRLLFVLACLVTLFVLFHVEENWRGESGWVAYKQQMETKGEKFDLAAFVPPRVPDEQNFAMTPFFAPLFDFEPGTQKQRDTNAVKRIQDFASSLPSGQGRGEWAISKRADLAQWLAASQKPANASTKPAAEQAGGEADSAKVAAAVLEKLGKYNPILDELRAASRRPYCRFNLSYDVENPVTMMLPHLQVVIPACRVLQLRALAKLASGQTDAAFDDVNFMFYLSDSTKNEPTLVSHLVRITNLNMSMQVIWEGLVDRRWSEAQLQALQTRLQSFDFLADYKRTLQAERAGIGNGTIEFLIKSPNKGTLFDMTDGGPSLARKSARFVTLDLLPRGWWRMEQLNYNRVFDDMFFPTFDVVAKRVYPKIMVRNTEAFNDSMKSPFQVVFQHRVLVRLLCPALDACLLRLSNAQTMVDEAMIACALERHHLASGQFPETLNALTPRFIAAVPHDIISGEPLKYRRTDDGQFVLYSVGWNEKDDGGVPGMTKDKSPRADQKTGDWVWRYPAKK